MNEIKDALFRAGNNQKSRLGAGEEEDSRHHLHGPWHLAYYDKASHFFSRLLFFFWILLGSVLVYLRWIFGALLLPEPKTPLKSGNLGPEKRIVWLPQKQEIVLDEVKAIGRKHGATVNDVVTSCIAGAIERYILSEARGGHHQSVRYIRMNMPVNLRPLLDPNEEWKIECGNQFGFITVSLPISGFRGQPERRLDAVVQEILRNKKTAERYASKNMSLISSFMPRSFALMALKYFARASTGAITNIRGSPIPLSINGNKISTFLGFAPASGLFEITFLIISYNGKLNLCISANKKSIQKPESLLEHFLDEYISLRDAEVKKMN